MAEEFNCEALLHAWQLRAGVAHRPIWSGVDYELERLDLNSVHSPAFMALNPTGSVPALMINEGSGDVVVSESLAILLYIASQTPDLRLGPADGDRLEQAKVNEILSELVSEVHKAFTPAFVPQPLRHR